MSAFVRNAGEADIDGICSLLHNKMNSKIPVERWRRLMTYEWLDDKPDFGRVVDADGVVLGFCGMVYSDRLLGSEATGRRMERMVSMSSWYLDRSLRGMGLGSKMLVSSIADPMMTYATLTNSPKPLAKQDEAGLRVLEDHRYLWHKKAGRLHAGLSHNIESSGSAICEKVPEHEQLLINDMASQPLTPYLLQADGVDNLLFFSIKRKAEHITWYDLMYASDLNHFSNHGQGLADALLPDSPSVLAADGRFVTAPAAEATREMLPVPRYFKPALDPAGNDRVAPHEVDHLYSELQLLDFKLD